MFSEKEIAYLKSQRLARIATTSEDMQPDVAPVGFDFDGTYFYVGGINLPTTLKYKNVQKNPKVSLVIDDLESTSLGNRVALSFMGSLTSPHVKDMSVLQRISGSSRKRSGVGESTSQRSEKANQ
jgi:PPOX class F420-dependent enzyme/OxyR family protein